MPSQKSSAKKRTVMHYSPPVAVDPVVKNHALAPGVQNGQFLPAHCKAGYGRNPLGAPYQK